MLHDTFIWQEMDISWGYNKVVEFFRQYGCGTSAMTETYSGESEEMEMAVLDSVLQASCVEDLPERVVIAQSGFRGCGERFVLKPIRPR